MKNQQGRRLRVVLLIVGAVSLAAACKRHAALPPPPPIAPVVPVNPTAEGAPAPLPPPIAPGPKGRAAIRHVVIISEDGLRPDALMGVRPPVHDELLKRAAYSLKARTIRHASTLPSHAAMLSGFDMKEHGLYWNSWKPERGYILVPTIFDAAQKAGGGAVAFVGKKKLNHITRPGSVDVFSRPGYFCKKVVEDAARYFVDKRPQVEFIHFSDPDDLGHSDGWMSNPQLESVRATDKCLGTLLTAVAAAGLDRDTLFIISADHGGHGHNHDGKIPEDRLIPWIAWGPGVRKGYKIKSEISTVDTAATARWALGYPAPAGAIGRPVLEAFEDEVPPPDLKEVNREVH